MPRLLSRPRRARGSRVVALSLIGLVACATATGDVSGGGIRNDYDPTVTPEPFVPPTSPHDDTPPSSWKALYRDFFGVTARSSCARPSCHGAPGQDGSEASSFVCANVDQCFVSMRTARHPRLNVALVEDSAIADPASANLFKMIRFIAPDGTIVENAGMPMAPAGFAFTPADIDRLLAWIRAGAKND